MRSDGGDDDHQVRRDAGDLAQEVRSETGQVALGELARREDLQNVRRLRRKRALDQGPGGQELRSEVTVSSLI